MPLTPAEYEMLAAFRYTLRRFLAFTDRVAGTAGLTQQQYQALLALRAHAGAEPMTISELAEMMLIKHHSAVGMVNRLEEQGLVRRERSTHDARKVGLRLTTLGARTFDKLASVQRAELRRIGPDMGRFMDYFARAADEAPRPWKADGPQPGRKTRSR